MYSTCVALLKSRSLASCERTLYYEDKSIYFIINYFKKGQFYSHAHVNTRETLHGDQPNAFLVGNDWNARKPT